MLVKQTKTKTFKVIGNKNTFNELTIFKGKLNSFLLSKLKT